MVQRALQNPELLSKLLSSTAAKKLPGPGKGIGDVDEIEGPEANRSRKRRATNGQAGGSQDVSLAVTPYSPPQGFLLNGAAAGAPDGGLGDADGLDSPGLGLGLDRQLSGLPSLDSGDIEMLDSLMDMIRQPTDPEGGGARRPSSPPAPRPGPALTEMRRFRRPDPRPALKQKNKNKTHGPVTKGTNWNLKVACAYRLSIQRDSCYGRLSPGTAWRAGAQAGAPAEKKKKKSPESLGRGGGTSSDREGQENVTGKPPARLSEAASDCLRQEPGRRRRRRRRRKKASGGGGPPREGGGGGQKT